MFGTEDPVVRRPGCADLPQLTVIQASTIARTPKRTCRMTLI